MYIQNLCEYLKEIYVDCKLDVQPCRSKKRCLFYISKEDVNLLTNIKSSELNFNYRAYMWAVKTNIECTDPFVVQHRFNYKFFLLLTLGGCAIGAFQTEVMYLALIVITNLILATVFPTTGANSSTNAIILFTAIILILMVLTGMGENLLKEGARFIGRSLDERKFVSDQPLKYPRYTMWETLLKHLGEWNKPWMVGDTINFSLHILLFLY